MRRTLIFLAAALCLVAACSSSSEAPAAQSGTTPTSAEPTSTVPATTSTTRPATTTTAACPTPNGTTAPITTATVASAALLRAVRVNGERCADRVVFDFTTKANAPPKCTIAYDQPPFYKDASGAPVTVSGSAFVRVRCEPAYGYDYTSGGDPTYTGPRQITATGTKHVRELVETGDFEGVLTWIIGLDAQRPFSASTTTVVGPQALNRLAIAFF